MDTSVINVWEVYITLLSRQNRKYTKTRIIIIFGLKILHKIPFIPHLAALILILDAF